MNKGGNLAASLKSRRFLTIKGMAKKKESGKWGGQVNRTVRLEMGSGRVWVKSSGDGEREL